MNSRAMTFVFASLCASSINAGGNKSDGNNYLQPLAYKTVKQDMEALGLEHRQLDQCTQMSITVVRLRPYKKKQSAIEKLKQQIDSAQNATQSKLKLPAKQIKITKLMKKKFYRKN